MKNKTHLTVIVIALMIMTAMTTAAGADQPVQDANSLQSKASKADLLKVAQIQDKISQVLVAHRERIDEAEKAIQSLKPDTETAKSNTFTDAELKVYKNNIIDRTETFYNNHMSHFFTISNVALILLGLITTVLVAFASYMKWGYDKKIKDQLAEQTAEFKVEVQKAHKAIEKQGKGMEQQFNHLRNEMESRAKKLDSRIYCEQALRYKDSGTLSLNKHEYFHAFLDFIFASGSYALANEFENSYLWFGRAVSVAKLLIQFKTPCDEGLYHAIEHRLSRLHEQIDHSNQYDRFESKSAELSTLMNELKKQIVPTDMPPADKPDE